MGYITEHNIFIFLVQVFLLLALARGLGEIFRRYKQPPLTAEILVGVLLGPTILGRFFPQFHGMIFPADAIQHNMLETLSWLGVLFLLLETGLEIDFSSAWRQRGDALKIALADIIVPMVIAFVPCLFLPDRYLAEPGQRLIFAIFMATVMTISAMPVAARALHDLNLSKSDLAFLIMSALAVNDIIGWLIFTLVLGFSTQAQEGLGRVLLILFSTLGFTAFCLTIGRRLSDAAATKIRDLKMPEPGATLTFICLLGLAGGAITHKIGIHALFGFFIAGIMAGGAKALSERTRQVISNMVYAVFVPLFFAGIGLKIDFLKNLDVFLVLLISIVGIGGRFLGAWVGVGLTNTSRANRLSISIAHTPGGAMEIVVGILALQYKLITEPVFVAIVFGAVASSVILGPWLSYSIRKRKEISILEFFSPRAVAANLKADTRFGVIAEMCDLAAEQKGMTFDAQSLCAAVTERENIMGTAMEEGIAFPHARLKGLESPLVVFARSVQGIDWDSPDGKATGLIFLILTPLEDDEAQVQILGNIARAMFNKSNRNALIQAADTGEIWTALHEAVTPLHLIRK